MLTTEKVATTSGAFLFIGRDTYAASGGTITVNLFRHGAEGFADQPELVQELAEDKLDAIADEYRAQAGTRFPQLERPYDLYMKGSISPAKRAPAKAKASGLPPSMPISRPLRRPRARTAAASLRFPQRQKPSTRVCAPSTAKQITVGGVALWVSHDGSVGTSNSLFADLSRTKTQIVQEAVAADPVVALDVLLDSLAGQVLHGAHSYRLGLEVEAKPIATAVPDELMTSSGVRPVEETMATRFAFIPAKKRFMVPKATETRPDDK